MINQSQLKSVAWTATDALITTYLPLINSCFDKYQINTPLRMAHFLAQVCHESGCFRYNQELASGAAYEGRKDLGNVNPGDGVKFKGRGLMQLTGRANYVIYGKAVNEDLITNPTLVAGKYAVDVAGWYWSTHGLNVFADKDDITTITKRINGGLNGFASRQDFLARAKKALGI